MSSDLEEQLTQTLARAAEDAPVPGYDPVTFVRGRQRRRRRRRAGIAAACAVAVATTAVLTGVRLAVPQPDPAPGYVFSPDRIPDFTDLPAPEKVWPKAVHRLPATLPDGSRYAVVAVLGDDRYLVARDRDSGEGAPSIFDTRAGTVTTVGTSAVSDGLAMATVLMAREVDGQVVWFLEGARDNRVRREVWVAPVAGGRSTRLAILPDGTAPRFGVAGNAIIWEQESRHRTAKGVFVRRVVRSVSLSGRGGPVDVPNSLGFQLADVGSWITDQLDVGTPRSRGELRNVVTGQRVAWSANSRIQFLRCGPTWCTGRGDGDRVALQGVDGSGRVELPFRGQLSPTGGGRLAVGYLELPKGTARVIWDRTTGRATSVLLPEEQDSGPPVGWNNQLSDWEPEVLTVRATGDELVVLDLGAIR
ncbi:MAG: hypothetical protein WA890_21165 [Micromonospora sp.]